MIAPPPTISSVRIFPASYSHSGQHYLGTTVLYQRNGRPASARLNWVLRSAEEAKCWLEAKDAGRPR